MTSILSTIGHPPFTQQQITPKIQQTAAGPVEYADFGSGPTVVALHGAMGGWDQSKILAEAALSGGFRVLAISRPGYLCTPIQSGAKPEQQADLVAALLDSLGIERAAVIAVSGGGPCALFFALRHAHRCSGLVLISTVSGKNDVPIPFSFHFMKAMARIPWVVSSLRRKALGNLEKSLARSILDEPTRQRLLHDAEVMPLYIALMESTFARMAERVTGTNNDIRVSRTYEYPLEQLQTPSLIIHGTADRLISFNQHAKAFASRLPNAKLLAVEGGEHVTLFTHRDRVRHEVCIFLKNFRESL